MQRPPLFEANCFIYWKNRFETYVKSKDIDLWCIIVYGNYKPTIKDNDGNKQVKDNNIDLFVQKYEEFIISDDETIDCAFARFNTIITSLKALDESFSSRNHVRTFLRALPTKWRPKDLEISKSKKEKYKSLALKERKVLSEEETTSSDNDDEEYAMTITTPLRSLRIEVLETSKKSIRPYSPPSTVLHIHCMDIANITRKQSKPDKHEHGNG
ncbi:hypothetical protein Tco_0367027 [Tanacetum coccineum]